MEGFGYLCALVLAVTFVRAAAAKLARPALTAAGFGAMGLPAPGVLSRAVPVVELAVAALLVALPAVGGVVALALLVVFSVVLARAVRAGVSTGCTCFGAVSSEPVSSVDLQRNLLLAGLALGALDAPEPVVPSVAAVVLVGAAALAGVGLLRLSRRRSDR
ncbi:MAG: MauE/DoxX family redox-associated membrane protein [Acidimicrobiales bacterium]